MKCTNCQSEWTPPKNISLSKCPFCHADILHMLNKQAKHLSTEVILSNMLQVYGTELLQNQQRLSAMISDLFSHDPKTKRLLLLSVQEKIPEQLVAIEHSDTSIRTTQVQAIQHRLAEDAFLKVDAAEQIVTFWINALGWEIDEPDDSFEIVWEKGYCGFRNSKGEMITQYKYDNARRFNGGLACVKLNGKCGFVDKMGQEVISLKYQWDYFDYAPIFSEGIARIQLNRTYGFINKFGQEITPIKYIVARNFREGLCEVGVYQDWDDHKSLKCGFINQMGHEVIPLEYNRVEDFSEGLAGVEQNGKWGFIDKSGHGIIPSVYDEVGYFIEGLAKVKQNGKWGFIDKSSHEIIPLEYDDVGYFIECDDVRYFIGGLALVKLNGKWGFID